MTESERSDQSARGVRRILLATLLIGMVGTGSELWLIDHTESVWQWVPLALIGTGLLTVLWHLIRPSRATVRVVQLLAFLFLVSGAVGFYLHYDGNVEFELEMTPEMEGWELFQEAMTGATPALAPGGMILLGLVSIAFAFHHPLTSRRGPN